MALSRVAEFAISLPFRIDDFGSIANTSSQISIWADRVRSAVGTTLTERVMRPEFGTTIPESLFESIESMEGIITPQISSVFENLLPTLTLDDVTISYDESSNTITAEVLYTLPNREQTSVSIGVAYIDGNTPIQENLL